jgi:hypothetical protein
LPGNSKFEAWKIRNKFEIRNPEHRWHSEIRGGNSPPIRDVTFMKSSRPTRLFGLPAVLLLLHAVSFAGAARALCVGDCNDDGRVTVDEVLTGVAIALGGRGYDQCWFFDDNGDRAVDVTELVTGLNGALNGCPSEQGWSGWREVPGGFQTDVAPTTTSFYHLHLIAKGTFDDRLYNNIFSNGVWQGWTALPSDLTTDSAPSATVKSWAGVQRDPLLLVYARGRDNQVWFSRAFVRGQPGLQFGSWSRIPGLTTSLSPGAASNPCGTWRSRVYAVDAQQRVFFNDYDTENVSTDYAGTWRSWRDTQSASITPVAGLDLESSCVGTRFFSTFGIGVFYLPYLGDLSSQDIATSRYIPPENFQTDAALAAAFCGDDSLATNAICVLAKNTRNPEFPQPYEDAAIYINRFQRNSQSWSGWSVIPGGVKTDQPVAAVQYRGKLYVFAKPRGEQRILANIFKP